MRSDFVLSARLVFLCLYRMKCDFLLTFDEFLIIPPPPQNAIFVILSYYTSLNRILLIVTHVVTKFGLSWNLKFPCSQNI
jgi:hypothetical protein